MEPQSLDLGACHLMRESRPAVQVHTAETQPITSWNAGPEWRNQRSGMGALEMLEGAPRRTEEEGRSLDVARLPMPTQNKASG